MKTLAVAFRTCQLELHLYAKNEEGDVTSAQLKVLAKLVGEEFT